MKRERKEGMERKGEGGRGGRREERGIDGRRER